MADRVMLRSKLGDGHQKNLCRFTNISGSWRAMHPVTYVAGHGESDPDPQVPEFYADPADAARARHLPVTVAQDADRTTFTNTATGKTLFVLRADTLARVLDAVVAAGVDQIDVDTLRVAAERCSNRR